MPPDGVSPEDFEEDGMVHRRSLVAVNGGITSGHAVQEAVRLAKAQGAHLRVVAPMQIGHQPALETRIVDDRELSDRCAGDDRGVRRVCRPLRTSGRIGVALVPVAGRATVAAITRSAPREEPRPAPSPACYRGACDSPHAPASDPSGDRHRPRAAR